MISTRVGVNVQTLAATLVLGDADLMTQVLDPDGASKTVKVLGRLPNKAFFYLKNSGTVLGAKLDVTDRADAAVVSIDAGEVAIIVGTGTGLQGIVLSGDGIGSPRIITKAFAYDDTSVTLATIPDGQVWLIHDVFAVTGTDWDGNGLATIGDGNDADGFLACSNASLDPAYDESGGITGWTAGSVGLQQSNRGVYLFNTTEDSGLGFRYAPSGAAETIDITVTTGTSTAGASTAYLRYTRIS